MSNGDFLFTSESVSEGHPDKICDRISDEVVDVFMATGENARVGCETLVTTNRVVLAGEVRGPESITATASFMVGEEFPKQSDACGGAYGGDPNMAARI